MQFDQTDGKFALPVVKPVVEPQETRAKDVNDLTRNFSEASIRPETPPGAGDHHQHEQEDDRPTRNSSDDDSDDDIDESDDLVSGNTQNKKSGNETRPFNVIDTNWEGFNPEHVPVDKRKRIRSVIVKKAKTQIKYTPIDSVTSSSTRTTPANEDKVECEDCPGVTYKFKHLKEHIVNQHKKDYYTVDGQRIKFKGIIPCSFRQKYKCKEFFATAVSANTHAIDVHNCRPYKCDFGACEYETNKKKNLTAHQKGPCKFLGTIEGLDYECNICGSTFGRKHNWQKHMKKYHELEVSNADDALEKRSKKHSRSQAKNKTGTRLFTTKYKSKSTN